MYTSPEALCDFIGRSPSAFHAISTIIDRLLQAGFTPLSETSAFALKPGGRYFLPRNGSSLIAFTISHSPLDQPFKIIASHSDSPALKLKGNPLMKGGTPYVRLNAEVYGGAIYSSWFDRPLSVAGRLSIRTPDGIKSQLVHIDRDLLMLPSIAIHMNRDVNKGYAYDEQKDLCPVFGLEPDDFYGTLCAAANVELADILSSELSVYCRSTPSIWANGQLISAPRLDDLQCAYASLEGFIAGVGDNGIDVYCCFDNEEVGSRTRQGAASTFLSDVLRRISFGLGRCEEQHRCAVASSILLSADNAHAVHPSHPELSDEGNRVHLNGGIVIKRSASQSYATDSTGAAIVRSLSGRVGVPVQHFANRSNMRGGSTLGNIVMAGVSVQSADIGLAQLAMHSSVETAGVQDTEYMAKLAQVFYASDMAVCGDGFVRIGDV